jgi:hypothetical protein
VRSTTLVTKSEHIARLSTPKTYKKPNAQFVEADFRGLISTDFRPAEQTFNGARPQTVKEFPVPWCLYSTVKTTALKGMEETQHSQLAVEKDSEREREKRYAIESMEQLAAFNARHGELKGRVGFPRIQLEQLKRAAKQ